MKLTPWFPGTVKPVRVGVYERDFSGTYAGNLPGLHYCYWNGKFWGLYGTNPKIAVWYQDKPSLNQNFPWRGVEK